MFKPWTAERDAYLVHNRNFERKTWIQIGRELGASKTACQRRYVASIPVEQQIDLGTGCRRRWASDLEAQAWHLRYIEKKKYADIAAILGMTPQQVSQKLDRMRAPSRRVHFELKNSTFVVPQQILDDRARRYSIAPRDITSAFCGDPLPGFSALEKRA